MTAGRDMPWLQDTTGGDVTTSWGADYRDFLILDPANMQPIAAYNLTQNSLSDPENRAELTAILLGLAVLKDEDADKLSDYWEDEMFEGDRSGLPADDRDNDRGDALLEYSLGSHAANPASLPDPSMGSVMVGGEEFQTITFRQRLGAAGGLKYTVGFSRDAVHWSSAEGNVIELSRTNPYDGTGTEIVTFQVASPISENGRGFLRVRATIDS